MRTVTRQQLVYAPRLTTEMKVACGASASIATGPDIALRVFVDDIITDQQVDTVLAAHDPTPPLDPLVVAITQAKTDAGTTPIDGLTVAQAVSYINTNVTDLTSAKAALVIAVKYIGEMRRELNLINNRLGL